MFARSYKYYLGILEKNKKTSPIQKLIIVLACAVFIVVGTSSALLYYFYQKERPIRLENQYLENTSGGFNSAGESFREVLSLLQVAGAKAQIIDDSKESSPSALGYFVSLDDVQKIISSLEKVEANTSFQKKLLEDQNPPQKYTKLHDDLKGFYQEVSVLTRNLTLDQRFLKDMLVATGPDFYLPVLTTQNLWKDANKDEIIKYYENIKSLANTTLAKLSKISTPEKFKPYYEAQIAYLSVAVQVSDNVISTLNQDDGQDKNAASQLEKAYQLLVGAQRENEKNAQKLTEQKLKIFSLKKNLEEASSVNLKKDAIKLEINDLYLSQKTPKLENMPIFKDGLGTLF